MSFFETFNSLYELDRDNNRIRRLSGINDPTPRQGPDGDWRSFESISSITEGRPVTIGWRTVDYTLQATETSLVMKIWD